MVLNYGHAMSTKYKMGPVFKQKGRGFVLFSVVKYKCGVSIENYVASGTKEEMTNIKEFLERPEEKA